MIQGSGYHGLVEWVQRIWVTYVSKSMVPSYYQGMGHVCLLGYTCSILDLYCSYLEMEYGTVFTI